MSLVSIQHSVLIFKIEIAVFAYDKTSKKVFIWFIPNKMPSDLMYGGHPNAFRNVGYRKRRYITT